MAAAFAAHRTLGASTVVQLALTTVSAFVRAINVDGTSAVYVRWDGTDPVVKGDDSYVIAAEPGAFLDIPLNGKTVPAVKYISAGTPTVALQIVP